MIMIIIIIAIIIISFLSSSLYLFSALIQLPTMFLAISTTRNVYKDRI